VHLDTALLDLAALQGGIIRADQALALGMTRAAIARRVKTGRWCLIARSTYRLINMADALSRTRAAVASLPGAVTSHETAAEIHSIPYVERGMAVVTVHSQTTHFFPDVVVHRSHDLNPDHIELINDLRVTTLARTFVDLAALLRSRHLSTILDDLIASGRVTIEDVQAVVSTVARRGKPGSATLRKLVEQRWSIPNTRASRLEVLGLTALRDALLPEPKLEHPTPWDPHKRFDAAYPEQRLAIEWDSRRWHTQVEAFQKDRKRDRLATIHGWRLLRFTWDDLAERPGEVVDTVARLLGEFGNQ
jgi:very-short-patch-repair endonuclease